MGDNEQGSGENGLTRRNGFGLSMLLLSLSAALILLGTLTPILTGYFGMPASVDSSFYTMSNAPLGLLIMLMLGLVFVLDSTSLTLARAERDLAWPVAALAVCLLTAYFLGLRNPFDLLFTGVGAFALVANIVHGGNTIFRRGLRFAGGHIAHMGVIFILVGYLLSSNYVQSGMVYLHEDGNTDTALGYAFAWQGYAGEDVLRQEVEVRRGSYREVLNPLVGKGGGEETREPGIGRHLFRDIYVSPVEIMAEFSEQTVVEVGRFFAHDELSLQFVDFTQLNAHDSGQDVVVQAQVLVRYLGEVQTIYPRLVVTSEGVEYRGVPVPHTTDKIFLQALDVTQRLAWFTFGAEPAAPENVLVLEVKTKPFVVLASLGGWLLCVGTIIAVKRRFSTQ